jgi:lactate dehydrogenase-like 2-hydroxyacid dehydrogenase
MTPTANKTLDGHKLLVLLGVTGPPKILLGTIFKPEWVAELHELFPGLEVVIVEDTALNTPSFQKKFPDNEWKDVTILLTGSALPTIDIAPKLEYIQLQSAGANHVLNNPLIRDTNIALCTASGVHGYATSRYE